MANPKTEVAATSQTENNQVLKMEKGENGIIKNESELLKMFERVDDSELVELTSNILKLGEGDVWNGIVTNEKQQMDATDEKGEDYEGYIGYSANGREKTILSDAVVLGAFDDFFKKYPNITHCLTRISCKGMKKSSKDAKREYRDLTVKIAPPQN